MAFAEVGMISIGSGGSYNPTTQRRSKIWHYISNDNKATTVASGYFNAYADKLQKGDIILVSGVAGGTLVTFQIAIADIVSGVVTTVGVS